MRHAKEESSRTADQVSSCSIIYHGVKTLSVLMIIWENVAGSGVQFDWFIPCFFVVCLVANGADGQPRLEHGLRWIVPVFLWLICISFAFVPARLHFFIMYSFIHSFIYLFWWVL